jgi:hypothetical protein
VDRVMCLDAWVAGHVGDRAGRARVGPGATQDLGGGSRGARGGAGTWGGVLVGRGFRYIYTHVLIYTLGVERNSTPSSNY